ncbi:hypothetical protein BDZ91DRAFT_735757 [Kalaharituber pfeilii]|nr:hypothetical protein BDZ91DRAFT_735757 [Kalaharituber pfeilii]
MTSTLHWTTNMAKLNPHDILTPDLLLAIGIKITEYMLSFYNQTPMRISASARKCISTGGLFFSKPAVSFGRPTLLIVLTLWVG